VTCEEFAGFMADYLGGELPSDTVAIFEHHLTLCPTCVAYLSNYRATIAAGKRAFKEAGDQLPPDEVPEDLIRAVLAARRA